ncbi:MAG: hypothetical protein M1825_004086 [Sarcosagium campestre]|nr:MAG: hypothetical protein M1825_004086 [Sarcosagium campestre]
MAFLALLQNIRGSAARIIAGSLLDESDWDTLPEYETVEHDFQARFPGGAAEFYRMENSLEQIRQDLGCSSWENLLWNATSVSGRGLKYFSTATVRTFRSGYAVFWADDHVDPNISAVFEVGWQPGDERLFWRPPATNPQDSNYDAKLRRSISLLPASSGPGGARFGPGETHPTIAGSLFVGVDTVSASPEPQTRGSILVKICKRPFGDWATSDYAVPNPPHVPHLKK